MSRPPPQQKSYGQFCALARALDRVGNRWSLLILRELFGGPAGFSSLRRALPGIASNLLARRLAELERDGLITRSTHQARSKAVRYQLTDGGAALEPAVLALIRWGAAWMASGPGSDVQNAAWLPLALRALLADSRIKTPTGTLLIEVDDVQVTVRIGRGGRQVSAGPPTSAPRAVVRGPYDAVLALVGAERQMPEVVLAGDTQFVAAALRREQSTEV